MAIYRIGTETATSLLESPESGMGFQVLRHRDRIFIVLNATVIFPIDDFIGMVVSGDDYLLLSGDPDSERVSELETMKLDGEFSIVFSHLELGLNDRSLNLTFTETVSSPPRYVTFSKRPYSYYRFCAYYRDKRVDQNTGSFLPGTYATTYTDLHSVPSGFAAVGRYAIPNPASARFVSQVVTYDRPTLMGTSPPNFGQAGGGVEVLFQNGARNAPGRSFMIEVG